MIRLQQGAEFQKAGKLSEAECCFRDYLDDFPNDPYALGNLGNVYRDRGRIAEADALYRQALTADPQAHWIHSNRLMTLNYSDRIAPETLLQEHREWGKQLPVSEPPVFRNTFDPKKRIHIGFVSADFRWHSVAFFLFGLLRELDREQFEVTCINESRNPDEMTEMIRTEVSGWVNTADLEDEGFIKTVRRCRLDVLVDLSGHTAYNRMPAIAQRCAPLQIGWLGYPTITGNPGIDYWVTDAIILGDSQSTPGREQPLLLPEGMHCYYPPVAPGELPLTPVRNDRSGNVVLGCFNHRAKLTETTLNLFADVLLAEPRTELLLKGRSFNDPAETEVIQYFMSHRGIAPERLRMLARTDTTLDHLKTYYQVDIALDTFPYNGTTTTCEALWMGVPVVTLQGATHASRVGASLLTRLGCKPWIAGNHEAYVRAVSRLVQDAESRREFRENVRDRLFSSGLTDQKRFAGDFGNGIRGLWQSYCSGR